MEITTVGLDLAKNVFQVHAIGSTGGVVVRRSLRRAQVIPFFSKLPPCLIGMEACGTSHHWARELVGLGHEVRLMPPAYVKPYVKRGKNDAGDAEAICEAVTRPTMRFVPIKSVEQQAALALHRTRDLLVRQRTQLVNMIRGLLAEFGIAIPKGIARKPEWDLVRGNHQGQRFMPRKQAGHKTAPDQRAKPSQIPCNAGAIHTRTFGQEGAPAAPDPNRTSSGRRIVTQSRHSYGH